jgi:hypothetical protein
MDDNEPWGVVGKAGNAKKGAHYRRNHGYYGFGPGAKKELPMCTRQSGGFREGSTLGG